MSGRKPVMKCCLRCGRWGTRGYIDLGSRDSGRYECSNDRACKRRQHKDEWSSR